MYNYFGRFGFQNKSKAVLKLKNNKWKKKKLETGRAKSIHMFGDTSKKLVTKRNVAWKSLGSETTEGIAAKA